ncbi:Uncharacterized protein PBTT_04687 [Plasmodiophora brassicae]
MSSVQDLARLQRQMERGAAVGDWLNAESYANEAGVLARELGRYSQSATLHKEQLVFARKTDQVSADIARAFRFLGLAYQAEFEDEDTNESVKESRIDECLKAWLEAYEVAKRLSGDCPASRQEYGYSLLNLGVAYNLRKRKGDAKLAIQYLREYVDLMRGRVRSHVSNDDDKDDLFKGIFQLGEAIADYYCSFEFIVDGASGVDPTEAIALFDEYIRTHPTFVPGSLHSGAEQFDLCNQILFDKGVLLSNMGEQYSDEAESVLRSVRGAEYRVPARTRLAEFLLEHFRFADAIAELKSLITVSKDNAHIYEEYVSKIEEIQDELDPHRSSKLELALALRTRDMHSSAVHIYDEILRFDLDDLSLRHEAWMERVDTLENEFDLTGDEDGVFIPPKEIEDSFRRCINELSGHPELQLQAMHQLGLHFEKYNLIPQAKETFQEVIRASVGIPVGDRFSLRAEKALLRISSQQPSQKHHEERPEEAQSTRDTRIYEEDNHRASNLSRSPSPSKRGLAKLKSSRPRPKESESETSSQSSGELLEDVPSDEDGVPTSVHRRLYAVDPMHVGPRETPRRQVGKPQDLCTVENSPELARLRLATAKKSGDIREVADCCRAIGEWLWNADRPAEALQEFTKQLEYEVALRCEEGQMIACARISRCHRELRHWALSVEYAEKYLGFARPLDVMERHSALLDISTVLWQWSEEFLEVPFQLPARHRLLNRARSFLDESLDVINQIAKENQKVLDGKLRSLYNLGNVCTDLGDVKSAVKMFRAAQTLLKRCDYELVVEFSSMCSNGLGQAYLVDESFHEARSEFRRALKFFDQIDCQNPDTRDQRSKALINLLQAHYRCSAGYPRLSDADRVRRQLRLLMEEAGENDVWVEDAEKALSDFGTAKSEILKFNELSQNLQDGVLAAARELTIRREMLEIAEFLSNFSEVATQASHIVALTTDRCHQLSAMSKWAIALLKLGKFSQVVAVARQQLELIADASSPSDATVQDHFWCLYLLAYAQMQLPGARRVEIDGDLAEMRRLKTTLCGNAVHSDWRVTQMELALLELQRGSGENGADPHRIEQDMDRLISSGAGSSRDMEEDEESPDEAIVVDVRAPPSLKRPVTKSRGRTQPNSRLKRQRVVHHASAPVPPESALPDFSDAGVDIRDPEVQSVDLNVSRESDQRSSSLSSRRSLSVRIAIEPHTFIVVCDVDSTIKWLADEAADRYFRLERRKPVIQHLLFNLAVVDASDRVVSLVEGACMGPGSHVEFIAVVKKWDAVSLQMRYDEVCRESPETFEPDEDVRHRLADPVSKIDLTFCLAGSKGLLPSVKVLHHRSADITDLLFDNSAFDDCCADLLSLALPALSSLSVLSLSNTNITSEGATIVISRCSDLETIDLHSNDLRNVPAMAFASFFERNSRLKFVDISYCCIRSVSFGDTTRLPCLTCFRVNGNPLVDATTLLSRLAEQPALARVNFAAIASVDARSIGLLISRCDALQVVNLGQRFVSEAFVEEFASSLQISASRLTVLDISGSQFAPNAFSTLCRHLLQATSVEKLVLDHCRGLSPAAEDIIPFVELILQASALSLVSLVDCELEDQIVLAMFEGQASPWQISRPFTLDFAYNAITTDCVDRVLSAIGSEGRTGLTMCLHANCGFADSHVQVWRSRHPNLRFVKTHQVDNLDVMPA